VTESLTAAVVLETLIDLNLVDLDSDGPWPGEPDEGDIYEPDWTQLHPARPDLEAAPMDNPGLAGSVYEEVHRRATGGFKVPPPAIIDALAWYTPIHYFGLGMAIYVRESAVLDVGAAILNQLEPSEREDEANVTGACRAAMSVLYLHEAFHHKIESLAIRYEMVERTRRYLPYSGNVVIPLLKQRSDDVLEEALACAEMYRRFDTEPLYGRGIPEPVRKATLRMLVEWFPTLPPSYRQAVHYLYDHEFEPALNTLMSQVQEATTTPKRHSTEWDLATHVHRGLFNVRQITHIIVPFGQTPVLPWIGHVPALPSVSTRKAIKLLEREGWKADARRGKGSHILMKHPDKRPLPIPANRESLTPGILGSLARALGVRVADL
jgi:predicted RNA binding protein YcfA (HicA-like mRNA interferase family)